jgi:hypothetical protein
MIACQRYASYTLAYGVWNVGWIYKESKCDRTKPSKTRGGTIRRLSMISKTRTDGGVSLSLGKKKVIAKKKSAWKKGHTQCGIYDSRGDVLKEKIVKGWNLKDAW